MSKFKNKKVKEILLGRYKYQRKSDVSRNLKLVIIGIFYYFPRTSRYFNNLVSMKRGLTRLFFYPSRYIELEFYVRIILSKNSKNDTITLDDNPPTSERTDTL